MQIVNIALLVFVIALLGYIWWLRYQARRRRPVSEQKLMLVVMRQRELGMKRALELRDEGRDSAGNELERQWQILQDRWIGAGAVYTQGFISDAAGLPSPGDQDWRLFYLYELVDYRMFRRCVAISEEAYFELLRHHMEVRLVPGERIREVQDKFRRIL